MFIFGTAGHIDHGKTAIIRALTGIDADRLPEEKEREMTIDLGFAWMDFPSGEKIGIVEKCQLTKMCYVFPARKRVRIRSIQTYKEQLTKASPGTRVALNLAGVRKEDIRRGENNIMWEENTSFAS